jgi:RND family efflux transporter MFP subunit
MPNKRSKIFLSIFLSLLILLSAFAFMVFMIKNKKPPKPVSQIKQPFPVEIIEIEKTSHKIKLTISGIVDSFTKAQISPEVSGKIIKISPELEKGNFISKNQFLFKTDPTDYEVLVKKNSSLAAKAESELKILISEGRTAQNEWEIFNKNSPPSNSLVFKIPQIKAARANLEFLQAEISKAKKDLLNTFVYSPFDAVILEENIEPGVFATKGQPVLTLVKANERQFIFPVSVNELFLLADEKMKFLSEIVKIKIPNSDIFFEAKIKGLLPDTDNETKMYKIRAEIQNLFKKYGNASFLLAEKSFVTGIVESKEIKDCFIIPSKAIRKNSTVWIMNAKNKLEIKKIKLLYHDEKTSVIKGDLNKKEKFITSLLNLPVSGMNLKAVKFDMNNMDSAYE